MKIHTATTRRDLICEFISQPARPADVLPPLPPRLPAGSTVTAIHLGGDHWHINGTVGGPSDYVDANVSIDALEVGEVVATVNEG